MKIEEVNIQLREGDIVQVTETDHPHLVQFSYLQRKQPQAMNFLITWNLATNTEVRSLRFLADQLEPMPLRVTKGIGMELNSFIPRDQNTVYDLSYTFPLPWLNGQAACLDGITQV